MRLVEKKIANGAVNAVSEIMLKARLTTKHERPDGRHVYHDRVRHCPPPPQTRPRYDIIFWHHTHLDRTWQ